MNKIQEGQIRNLKGQKVLVLENINGDYWLVCHLVERDAPLFAEEYQLPFPRLQAQYTLVAIMSERWLRFYSRWIGSVTASELTAVRSIKLCREKQKPIPKALEEKIGPTVDWTLSKEFLCLLDATIQADYKNFSAVVEQQE